MAFPAKLLPKHRHDEHGELVEQWFEHWYDKQNAVATRRKTDEQRAKLSEVMAKMIMLGVPAMVTGKYLLKTLDEPKYLAHILKLCDGPSCWPVEDNPTGNCAICSREFRSGARHGDVAIKAHCCNAPTCHRSCFIWAVVTTGRCPYCRSSEWGLRDGHWTTSIKNTIRAVMLP